MLPEFGETAQRRLLDSRVLVVGAGGLGSPVLLYLAGAGVGRIGIIDGDTVALHNLHRQVLFGTDDIGAVKGVRAREEVLARFPECSVELYSESLTPENARRVVEPYDLVIDGTDNFETRYLVNDICVELKKPWVSGAVFKFSGQVTLFNAPDKDGERGPTYRCLFPEPPPAEKVPGCGESGVLATVPGIVGMVMANEAVKYLSGVGEVLSGRLWIFDALTGESRIVGFDRDEAALKDVKLKSAVEYRYFCGQKEEQPMREITPKELKAKLDAQEDIVLIDVRESFERDIASIGGTSIPLAEVINRAGEIPQDKPVVIYCRSGGRSGRACAELEQRFQYKNLINLAGGILRWSDDVDSTVRKY
jgi:adenylyltransferase/sulfurtransferase